MKIIELESLRALASIYVFFHHTLNQFGLLETGSFFWRLLSFGQEAVMVFFILSGYVISMSMQRNNYTFVIYFKHRFFRIYSVVIISYIVSFISYCMILKNDFPSLNDLALNLLMLQDKASFTVGSFVKPIFNNEPLWSLSYEWWFYMIYFAQFYFFKNFSTYVNISFSLVITMLGMFVYYFIPNQISAIFLYYYLWFTGVALFYYFYNNMVEKKTMLFLFFGFVLVILTYSILFVYKTPYEATVVFPYIKLRHYIATFMFALLAVVFHGYIKYILSNNIVRFVNFNFAKLAPISFSIYLIHYPIMKAFIPIEISSGLKLLLTVIITLFIAYMSEIKFYSFLRKIFL